MHSKHIVLIVYTVIEGFPACIWQTAGDVSNSKRNLVKAREMALSYVDMSLVLEAQVM